MAKQLGDRTARIATRLSAIVHKGPVQWNGDDLVRFRSNAIDLLRHRWAALTAATLANQLTAFLVLVVSLRAHGNPHSEVEHFSHAFAAKIFTLPFRKFEPDPRAPLFAWESAGKPSSA